MTPTDDHADRPTLADIVREETNDGLRLLDFYIDALDGKLEGFTAVYRLEAAHVLLDMVVETPSPPDAMAGLRPCHRPGQ